MRARDRGEPTPNRAAPGRRAGADAAALRLQRMAGNRAVAQLLQREPHTETEAEPEHKPKHFPLTSDADTLPGDPVPALQARKDNKFTDDDRRAAKAALKERTALNRERIPKFIAAYAGSLVQIWTRYVTGSMSEAAEEAGWSFFGKLASFVVRATLLAVFPEFEVEELAAEIGAKIMEKGAELGLELGAEKVEEHGKSSHIEGRKEKLDEQSDELAEQLESVITKAFQDVFDEDAYGEWLDNAPLSQLYLFRIPPKAPNMSRQEIRTLVAQAIAGYVHEEALIEPGQQSIVEVGIALALDAPTKMETTLDPLFIGSEAFGKEFVNVPIRSLPKVPLYVELHDPEFVADWDYKLTHRVAKLFFDNEEPYALPDASHRTVNQIAEMFEEYPEDLSAKTIGDPYGYSNVGKRWRARISRDKDGWVRVEGGGLAEHLLLYEYANPGTDWRSLVREYVRGVGDPVSPTRTSKSAAKELHDALAPSLRMGAEELIRHQIEPLTVKPRKRG